MDALLKMSRISKRFGEVQANRDVSLEIAAGEIHGLVGENGAGKSTLMKILSGVYHPDSGAMYLDGKLYQPNSPADALRQGIGMVYQHFMLIPTLTVTENVVLGDEPHRLFWNDRKAAVRKVTELSNRFGLQVDPQARVANLSVSARQKVELLRVLYRGARIIILDEPTAVLTRQEVEELFSTLRQLAAEGAAVVFITHKLSEVLRWTDRITVLRSGQVAGVVETSEATAAELTRMMVGHEMPVVQSQHKHGYQTSVLSVKELSVMAENGRHAVYGANLDVHAGEILGIAGVDGNGQQELVDAIAGLLPTESGSIRLAGQDITRYSPLDRRRLGLAMIAEDRHDRGLVLDFSIAENALLGLQREPRFAGVIGLQTDAIHSHAAELAKTFDIRPSDPHFPTRGLSGGNQQKLVLARELSTEPRVLLACQPTRGLDIAATASVRRAILHIRDRGAGVLLVSLDLDEIIALSDRVAVILGGRIVECLPSSDCTPEKLGLLMTGGTL